MSTEPLENFEELARRAVACKRWRWMPGMLLVTKSDNTFRLVENDFDAQDRWEWKGHYSTPVPDLTDPATLGCLLALVREVWPDATTNHANFFDEDRNIVALWAVHKGLAHDAGLYLHSTEAEALVDALEGAP